MLKIIGAGFGRTGTRSLALALEKLGYGPCYTSRSVSLQQTRLWNRVLEGKPVDWDALFDGYVSAVEWPTVGFLAELIERYPQAKVVLTLRDAEVWYESASATVFDLLEVSAQNPDPARRERSGMKRRVILERAFENRHREKEYALGVYRRHIEEVIELVPPERLLKFHVREGWQPLCEFLEKPVLDEPFPMLNTKIDFIHSIPDWVKKTGS